MLDGFSTAASRRSRPPAGILYADSLPQVLAAAGDASAVAVNSSFCTIDLEGERQIKVITSPHLALAMSRQEDYKKKSLFRSGELPLVTITKKEDSLALILDIFLLKWITEKMA